MIDIWRRSHNDGEALLCIDIWLFGYYLRPAKGRTKNENDGDREREREREKKGLERERGADETQG